MIVPPTSVRVWLANGHTDMRHGMNGLALQVQQAVKQRANISRFWSAPLAVDRMSELV